MNEFIVWDEEKKELYTPSQMNFDGNGKHITTNRFKWCEYIGLNDIDGKKIYADSSIVEFKIRLNNKEFQGNYILKGYFEYDNDLCCYLLKCIDIDRVFIFAVSFLAIKNIKIIDTIQENKLGLIKDIK